MRNSIKAAVRNTIGLDLGDKYCHFYTLGPQGEFVDEGRIKTTPEALRERFASLEAARVVLETGTHSPWVSRLVAACGHEALVANPRQIPLIYQNSKKSDRTDPEILARVGRLDPSLLKPIQHRDAASQISLAVLRARDNLVGARSKLINHVRGAVKSLGGRVVSCAADSFHEKALETIPKELHDALVPVVKVIGELTKQIRRYDQRIEKELCEKKYPQTEVLREVPGVGPLTSLAFLLVLEDPRRFKDSRTVGAYLGLTPRKSDSGDLQPQLRITKAGDGFLRRLLVSSAHHILGPFGSDTDLRRFGEAMAHRGGKNAKKRAIIAVARKLAVLLHRLWLTGEVYEPLRNAARKQKTEAHSPAQARS
jgi:transposase